MAYELIVDGRWMTNDAKPTEVDRYFKNVYNAPPKSVLPWPEPSTAPSYHSEPDMEREAASDEPATNGTSM